MCCYSVVSKGCGLVKNLALMAHVTSDVPEKPIVRYLYNMGVEDVRLLSGDEINSQSSLIVYLNGQSIIFDDVLVILVSVRISREVI